MTGKKSVSCIGNKRSGELHIDSCPWVKMMSQKNRVFFNTLLASQKAGFTNGCGHCMKEPLPRADSTTKISMVILKVNKPCPAIVNRGETITLRAKLEVINADNISAPGEGKKLTFTGCLYGGKYDSMGTGVTDSQGIAECQVTIPDDTPAGITDFKVCDTSSNCANRSIEIPTVVVSFKAKPTTFAQETTIEFELCGTANIVVEIYNNLNMHRKTLTSKKYSDGFWSVNWNGKNDSQYAFSYATKGKYTARLTVYDKKGHQTEATLKIDLVKTQWKP